MALLICDLAAHSREYQEVIRKAVGRVVDRGWYVLGPEVKAFEAAFARYVGSEHCLSVANGTDALELALAAGGVEAGARVATVANAAMYASTALLARNAIPLFMDVSDSTMAVEAHHVEQAIAAGAKAVVVTHLYGRAVRDIATIAEVCRQAGVVLVEDCAQAHGARIDGRCVGSFGDFGCFSFYPTKNLGALGDGGAVTTRHAVFADKVALLRQYGWSAKYTVSHAGARNSRLDEMQAAVLVDFLPHLDGWNSRRREIANRYSTLIDHPHVAAPSPAGPENVAHLYVVRSPLRDALRAHLLAAGIASDVHYPLADHRQPVFAERFADLRLPVTERVVAEVLTLPCYPELPDADVDRVIEAVNGWRP